MLCANRRKLKLHGFLSFNQSQTGRGKKKLKINKSKQHRIVMEASET